MSVEHYENFPVASLLCPPHLRPAVAAIYWFARTADDLADEGDAPAAQRLQALARYRDALLACAKGEVDPAGPWSAVFTPLRRALQAHALPVPLLLDLLDAFEQDVRNPPYPDRTALLDYCRRSANPVGRLLLHLYGVSDARSLQRSDAICSALQLINFWQDVGVDLPRDRCYLPHDDAARHGVNPANVVDGPALRALMASLCDWAQQLMWSGAPLALSLPGRAGWELRLVVQGGLRILEKIRAMNYATLDHRPTLRKREAPLLLLRALAMRPRT